MLKAVSVGIVGLSILSCTPILTTSATARDMSPASTSDTTGPDPRGFFSLFSTQAPAQRSYTPEHQAPHNGFDPHGDGTHPPIGPITD